MDEQETCSYCGEVLPYFYDEQLDFTNKKEPIKTLIFCDLLCLKAFTIERQNKSEG